MYLKYTYVCVKVLGGSHGPNITWLSNKGLTAAELDHPGTGLHFGLTGGDAGHVSVHCLWCTEGFACAQVGWHIMLKSIQPYMAQTGCDETVSIRHCQCSACGAGVSDGQ